MPTLSQNRWRQRRVEAGLGKQPLGRANTYSEVRGRVRSVAITSKVRGISRERPFLVGLTNPKETPRWIRALTAGPVSSRSSHMSPAASPKRQPVWRRKTMRVFQYPDRGPATVVSLVELSTGSSAQLLHRPVVEVLAQRADPAVECGQRQEAFVAQARQNPALRYLHADLNLRLAPRLARPGGHYRRAVVARHVRVAALQSGLVATRMRNRRLELIGHRDLGDALGVRISSHVRADQVADLLRLGGLRVGVFLAPKTATNSSTDTTSPVRGSMCAGLLPEESTKHFSPALCVWRITTPARASHRR